MRAGNTALGGREKVTGGRSSTRFLGLTQGGESEFPPAQVEALLDTESILHLNSEAKLSSEEHEMRSRRQQNQISSSRGEKCSILK